MFALEPDAESAESSMMSKHRLHRVEIKKIIEKSSSRNSLIRATWGPLRLPNLSEIHNELTRDITEVSTMEKTLGKTRDPG